MCSTCASTPTCTAHALAAFLAQLPSKLEASDNGSLRPSLEVCLA